MEIYTTFDVRRRGLVNSLTLLRLASYSSALELSKTSEDEITIKMANRKLNFSCILNFSSKEL